MSSATEHDASTANVMKFFKSKCCEYRPLQVLGLWRGSGAFTPLVRWGFIAQTPGGANIVGRHYVVAFR